MPTSTSLFSRVFGSVNWIAPPWCLQLAKNAKQQPGKFWGSVLALLLTISAAVGGYYYYQQLPKPLQVIADIDVPEIGYYEDDKEQPTVLTLHFSYDLSKRSMPTEPVTTLAAAKLDLLGEVLTQGASISPAINGKWLWQDDNTLTFMPEHAWPAGQQYRVELDDSIFAPDINLAQHEFKFNTKELTVDIQELQFYQHPEQLNQRNIVATLYFSHPVNLDSVKSALSLTMREDGAALSDKAQTLPFTLTTDKAGLEVYVKSAELTLPEHEQYLTIALDAGVQALQGNGKTQHSVSDKLLVPDQGSFLKVNEAFTDIINNPQQDPEQMLILGFTDAIERSELQQKVKIYLLPKHPKRRSGSWSVGEVNEAVLKQASLLQWQPMPTPRQYDTDFSIKLDLPPGQNIFVSVPEGLKSASGFTLSGEYRTVRQAPTYPKQATIVGEGAVLSLSGDKTLQLMSRGIPGVKAKLYKLLPQQLNHYISQTSGDINQPYFNNYDFDESNISAVYEKTFALPAADSKKASYIALSLQPYLDKAGLGMFVIELSAYDPKQPKREFEQLDKRMVMVSDLGLLVKHNADSSQQVFVMSIATGKPVAGVKVELLGKNGVALFTGNTDSRGSVSFGKTTNLYRERQPVVYLATLSQNGVSDSSFLPYDRYSRQLDYSKFNTGGSYQDETAAKALSAFIFTDRGIYRPGEQVQLAAIIRQADLALAEGKNLPLKIQLEGPRGNTFWQQKFALSGRGFNSFSIDTLPSSDTGRYVATISLLDKKGNEQRYLGSETFQIEEFQPDTLKISGRFNQTTSGWLSPKDLSTQIQLDNLFGTPAQQRRVSSRFELVPVSFNFAQFADYRFMALDQDGTARERVRETLPEQTTDADGKASFELPLEQYSGGTYRLMVHSEGFDSSGGRSVQVMQSAMVSPLAQLVGVKADGDLTYLKKQQQRALDFIAIDANLQQIALTDISMKLIENRAVSSLVKQPNDTYQYQSIVQQQLISEAPFTIGVGGSGYSIPTDQAGDFELQLVNAQQQVLSKVKFSVVGAGNTTAMLEKNAALTVKLDKADYKAGDWIELNITAPYTGSGLISIETEKVQAFSWFTASTTSSIQRIQLPEHLEGNAYINVNYVRGADSDALFVSPLSYAVVPFNIDRSSRELDISLVAPAEVRPGKPFTLGYKTSQPADVLIYGVDEGILQVAGYKLPDPLEHYLKKRALQVRSMQMLDLLLPEFTALQRQLAGVGGDMEAMMVAASRSKMMDSNLNPFARRADQPGVFWLGILPASTALQTTQVTVPQSFSGNIKLMAVAVSDNALGAKNQDLLVRGPFVLTPEVLNAAAPGDEFDVSLSVSNGVKGSGEKAAIQVQLTLPDSLQLLSDPNVQLLIDEGSEASARFRLKALPQLGEATLQFAASYQQADITEQASRDVSLSIRPASVYQTSIHAGYAKKGPLRLQTVADFYPQLAQQSVTASANPLVLAESLTDYLEQYPHGCTEQVVSQVMPWIGLVKQPAYQSQLAALQQKFDVLIQKLAERQQSDGGFSFWPGGYNSADFPSVYVMHFLLEAREQGLAVPDYLYEQGLQYLRTLAQASGANLYQARLRANAIYLLTRSGEVTSNYLVELHERLEKQHQQAWQSDITAVYMAASYQLLQKPDVALGLISSYRLGKSSALQQDYQVRIAAPLPPFANPAFQSQLSLDAQYVYLLSRHFAESASKLDGENILTLLKPVFDGQYNTIGSAYAILALSAYNQLHAADAGVAPTFYQLNAQDEKVALVAGDNQYALNQARFDTTASRILIESANPLFYALNEAGFTKSADVKAQSNQLEVVRDYLDADGKIVSNAKQGQELTVRLRVRSVNSSWQPNVAVVDLLPAGFSVVRSSVPRQQSHWRADYVDIREDRLVYYAGFGSQSTELRYQVKVTAAGDFVVPAVYATSMYDLSVNANSASSRFKVTPGTL